MSIETMRLIHSDYNDVSGVEIWLYSPAYAFVRVTLLSHSTRCQVPSALTVAVWSRRKWQWNEMHSTANLKACVLEESECKDDVEQALRLAAEMLQP